jgi:4-carboxymuconolactone decarboxylase
MSRLQMPAAADLTAHQAAACAEAVSGLRGAVPTPMIAWIRNPELARRAQRLGELLRYQTELDPKLSELAILVCARHWTSHVEWTAHKREGLKAGLAPEIAQAIAARLPPPFVADEERLVFDVSGMLLARGKLDPDLYATAHARLGERRLVELVALVGYYSLVALTLNAFELGLPERLAPELLQDEATEHDGS